MILCSVSVMADAFNNLSDAGSSIISFIGVKMAKPRTEIIRSDMEGLNIAAPVVSFLFWK